MAKKSPPHPPATGAVSMERARRLYRLLCLVSIGPQTRAVITRKLRLGIRGFYRDLEVLRHAGIMVELAGSRYSVAADSAEALESLPFPDPGLNLGEARQLAKGRSRAHKKIREQLEYIEA